MRNRILDGLSCGAVVGIDMAADSVSTSAVKTDIPSAQRLRLSKLFDA